MWSTAREIVPGDLVIVWLTREDILPLVITPGKEFNGKFGVYRHSDLVGVPYGSKVGSRNGKGFIHVLRPTPELWTMALPHRTQILYLADIAFVISYLDIKPGSKVIEADNFGYKLTILHEGTGSGSFSHSAARTIGRNGHLYSYEFHEARANKAREEFHQHNLSEIITLTHRNVCKDGFTVVDLVDSVFLDLPAPWDAVQHAKNALRKDRTTRVCCFSPCMEQVLRTVSALNEAGFTDITMYETLLRPHEVNTLPALRSVNEISNKLKKAQATREEKRLKQIAASQAKREMTTSKRRKRWPQDKSALSKEVENVKEKDDLGDAVLEQKEGDGGRECAKKLRMDGETADGIAPFLWTKLVPAPIASSSPGAGALPLLTENTAADEDMVSTSAPMSEMEAELRPAATTAAIVVPEPSSPLPDISAEPEKMVVSKVNYEVRGHTSYLTFARLLPTIIPHDNSDLVLDSSLSSIRSAGGAEPLTKSPEPNLDEEIGISTSS